MPLGKSAKKNIKELYKANKKKAKKKKRSRKQILAAALNASRQKGKY